MLSSVVKQTSSLPCPTKRGRVCGTLLRSGTNLGSGKVLRSGTNLGSGKNFGLPRAGVLILPSGQLAACSHPSVRPVTKT